MYSDDEVIPSPGRSLRRLGQATRQVAEEAASLASEQATAAAQQASEFAQEQYHEGAERAMEAYNNAPPAQELVLHADQHAHRMGKALARWTSESVIPSARETQRVRLTTSLACPCLSASRSTARFVKLGYHRRHFGTRSSLHAFDHSAVYV